MRVLIVEDNTSTREMLRVVVRKLGHEVAGEAADGDSAMKAFADLRPEAVLLDIIMPGKSGVQVMAEMLALDPAARIIIVTAVNQDEVNEQVAASAVAVIYKPFSYEEMRAAFRLLK
jgi:two-component system chemotaxis response regulator CheY